MKTEDDGLQRVVFDYVVIGVALIVGFSLLQYFLLPDERTGTPLLIWRLPAKSLSLCINQVCGVPSILLLYGAPLVGALAPILYYVLWRTRLLAMAKAGVFDRFDDPLFRMQSVIVVLMFLANALLRGALISGLVGDIQATASVVFLQALIIGISFVSLTLAGFNGLAGSRRQ